MYVIMNILNSKKTETAIQINDEFSHDVFYLDLLTASTESKGERRGNNRRAEDTSWGINVM